MDSSGQAAAWTLDGDKTAAIVPLRGPPKWPPDPRRLPPRLRPPFPLPSSSTVMTSSFELLITNSPANHKIAPTVRDPTKSWDTLFTLPALLRLSLFYQVNSHRGPDHAE